MSEETQLEILAGELFRLTDRATIEAEGVDNILDYFRLTIASLEASKLPRRFSRSAKLKLRAREIAAAYKRPIPQYDSNESTPDDATRLVEAYDLFSCTEARLKDKSGKVHTTVHSSEELHKALTQPTDQENPLL